MIQTYNQLKTSTIKQVLNSLGLVFVLSGFLWLLVKRAKATNYRIVDFLRYINSANFTDVDHLWNSIPQKKSATHCSGELLADPFTKIKLQKTENRPFTEFKYLEKPTKWYKFWIPNSALHQGLLLEKASPKNQNVLLKCIMVTDIIAAT